MNGNVFGNVAGNVSSPGKTNYITAIRKKSMAEKHEKCEAIKPHIASARGIQARRKVFVVICMKIL